MRMRAAVLASALALGACGADYDHTEITNVKGSPPFPGSVSYARIVVPVGMVVTAHVVSYDDDHKAMAMGLQSMDPRVVEVEGVVSAKFIEAMPAAFISALTFSPRPRSVCAMARTCS